MSIILALYASVLALGIWQDKRGSAQPDCCSRRK
jgi:hypothetical protein